MKSVTIFENLSEKKLFALCLYGEVRGEPIEGKIAVASVIINRFGKGNWYGKSLRDVILKPKQFSCFNESDPNRKKLEMIAQNFDEYLHSYEHLRECYWVAVGFLDCWLTSNVGKSTHYNTKSCDPKWDDNMKLVATIGNHEFFMEV